MLDKTEEAIRLGKHAEDVMNDPLIIAAFNQVGVDATKAWMNTLPAETEKREMLWLKMKVIDEVHSMLTLAISNGRVAQKKLET